MKEKDPTLLDESEKNEISMTKINFNGDLKVKKTNNKNEKLKVLVIEDDKVDQMAFQRFIKENNIPYDYILAGSITEAKEILESNKFELIISDYYLGDGTSFDILDMELDIPIVMVTGTGDEEIAVKAMKAGAYDYIIKDPNNNHFTVLPSTVDNALKRKIAEKARKESEVKYRDLYESSPESITIIDNYGIIVDCNDSTVQMTGIQKQNLIGQSFIKLGVVNEEYIELCLETFSSMMKGIETHPIEVEIKTPDVTNICLEVFPSIIKSDNEITGIQLIMRDITDRKNMEKELKKYTETLEHEVKQRTTELIQSEKMASIGQMVAGVAHEVNNPLGYINSNTEIIDEEIQTLREKLEEDEINDILNNIDDLVKTNIKGINRIATITKSLKRFAQPDQGEIVPEDINQGLKDTLLILYNQLKHRIEVDEEYGEIPKVHCNIGQLNQVFMNLIINASQAIEEGNIWIKTFCDENNVIIEIKDDGSGINDDSLSKIFDPFYTTKDNGTGLGLSLCYRIIKDHNGDIKVKSEVGKGTEMIIRIPRRNECE